MRKEMKKLFAIALLWATVSILSVGCVDVGNPSGNPNDPNQNNPDGNGGNDGNNNNDGNGGNDGNDGNDGNNNPPSIDPDDPMYPGETGSYITHWGTQYGTTTSPQKYIGATYDESNTATVSNGAPYKTTFSDGSVCYSIGKFVDVSYSREVQTDSSYRGNAVDGFVVVDYKYDENKNQVVYREDPVIAESTGNTSGKYTTESDYSTGYVTNYVTSQPILLLPYQKSSSGEIYYNSSDYNTHHATKWSDGSYTLSLYEFSDIDYNSTTTTDFSYDSASYSWLVGTAQSGRKESDYTFDESAKVYKYNAGGDTSGAATAETGDPIGDILEDAEDILGDILDNDGLRIQR
jgi:hypothetical protein